MSWEQRVDPLRFFYCSVAKGLKSITLSSYQPEVVKNKSELMSSWVNGKRLPLNWSLALQHRRGLPCKASTVLHHRSVVLFLKTNNLIKSKKAVQRAGRTWMYKRSQRSDCSSSLALLFSGAVYVLIPWQWKWLHTEEEAVWLISEVIPASCCWHGPFTVESVLTIQPCCCIHIPGLGFVPFLPTLSVCPQWLGCPPSYPCGRMAQCLLTEVESQFHKGTDEHWK